MFIELFPTFHVIHNLVLDYPNDHVANFYYWDVNKPHLKCFHFDCRLRIHLYTAVHTDKLTDIFIVCIVLSGSQLKTSIFSFTFIPVLNIGGGVKTKAC